LLDNGSVLCWGGGVGIAPVNLGANQTAVDISAGADQTCAVLADGKVRCWGANGDGQLGYGNIDPVVDPSTVAPVDLGFRRLAVDIEAGGSTGVGSGGPHTCALVDTGRVVCWGAN